jgi:hypothetical protein
MQFKYVVIAIQLIVNEYNKVLHLINHPLNTINYDFERQ